MVFIMSRVSCLPLMRLDLLYIFTLGISLHLPLLIINETMAVDIIASFHLLDNPLNLSISDLP
jgi:hypothetical protein